MPTNHRSQRESDEPHDRVGVVVGMAAEARIARRLGWPVAVGGGTEPGARAAAERLLRQGATAFVSFGLAGGLDPALRPGMLVIPETVLVGDQRIPADAGLMQRLGGATGHVVLGAARVAATVAEKRNLHDRTGADAIDLESGAVALAAQAAGIPFAVLRAICDPAERTLPHAALIALDRQGAIGAGRMSASIIAHPRQVGALLRLAADAASARRALLRRVAALSGARSRWVEAITLCAAFACRALVRADRRRS